MTAPEKFMRMNTSYQLKPMIGFIFLVLFCTWSENSAFALDEIYSPNVEEGEISLEYNGSRTFDGNSSKNNAQGHEVALEYGVNNRWEVETSAGFEKDPGNSIKLMDAEIESRAQFFNQGEYWMDTGALVAYDFAMQSQQSDSLEAKFLMQKDFGKITSRINVGFDQDVGKYAATGGPDYVFLSNTRYRYTIYFQPGIEIQGDLGQGRTLLHWDQQQNYLGPSVYGKLFGHLHYEIACFAGVSHAAAQSAARALLEYEMHF